MFRPVKLAGMPFCANHHLSEQRRCCFGAFLAAPYFIADLACLTLVCGGLDRILPVVTLPLRFAGELKISSPAILSS